MNSASQLHWFRLISLLLVALFLSGCFDSVGTDQLNQEQSSTPDSVDNGGALYQLVWADEFDSGNSPSLLKWRMDGGYGDNGWGNDEWQNYTNSPSNVSLDSTNKCIT